MPTYEQKARGNPNKSIVFCSIDGDVVRDAVQEYKVNSVPTFFFYLNKEQTGTFKGAIERDFNENFGMLVKGLSGKASTHMLLEFKEFKPMSKLPTSFENVSNFGKMSETIKKFSNESASKVKATASLVAWLDSINKNNINLSSAPLEAIDQLIELIKIG